MLKQAGPEALYGITDPIPVRTRDSPIVKFLMSLQARGSPHMERLMEQSCFPGPKNEDGHAFMSSPNMGPNPWT